MKTHKVEQLVIATVGFFWCFLMWFSTAAFSPSIANHYNLSLAALGLLASSAIWMAPIGRIVAGWAADRFGAPRTFATILAVCGLVSIASAYTTDYDILFIERVIVAIAGVSFVVGIQHVAQWFEPDEIGTAEGLYAGTGNVGAGVGALLLPRIFGLDYQAAFLWLGVIALGIAAWYLLRGEAAKHEKVRATARQSADFRGTVFVWTRYIAIALMLAYAMSFGLEIAMNAWLPGYFTRGFHEAILALGFTSIAGVQIAAGTFAAVQSFTASLFRPFSGFMSDLFQRRGWTPLPMIARTLPYAPRLHWLAISLLLITLSMVAFTVAGLMNSLPLSVMVLVAFGIFVSFGTGGTFALVPLLFPDRPGVAAGFIGGVSTAGGIVYPLVFAHVGNIHMGYLYIALFMFIPFTLFYFWAARYEHHPEDHGIGENWLKPRGETVVEKA
ncbi:nitrate/nitrite transporter [Acidihalobacter aeolianus]|uniref:Nitrate/nitrite transporter n=1 Tax=Acidihalobacter aeolianus TaxID=2792603 RepID=A0A1D8K8W0_9GAMM|nr:MFS transporter [Acidihalobacter aeolianus]AOV17398.1 nitrate/nitrite transporter [Acidihalobacter aeolianus]